MQFSCCSYIHWMLVDVIIYKIHEWIHFLWKLWRPSEDTFFPQIIDFLSLMWIDSSAVLDLRAGSSILFPSVKKNKISENSKNTFSHWFHTWKKHILSRKMMSSEDFFVLFFMWETKCGNKKKHPGYPEKNISTLIQTWKQKLIYKTFHLVSGFVFHVWDRIYKKTLLHVWKTKWKKSLCKRKPFLENLISFSVSNMKKNLEMYFLLLSQFLFSLSGRE